ncbi:uncharacterized protein LOC119640011 [Glossina fuscipes]|uniref:Uncharacterized protein LOC119640011 n=1 Tax=Glossina fuscipes TaxID=7396 RepID=A0A9C6DVY6_9MUSC|nr:uncharacterized protein LOC119640011 [Glossina fuscipes]KAI9579221.1 hypothetical protein GQX74_004693 [Glossina fuscipes]
MCSPAPNCSKGDKECLKNYFLIVLRALHQNYEGASMPAIRIKKDAEATDGLELIFENCFLFGIQKSTPVNIKGFTETIDQKHQIDFKLSRTILLADYQMEGVVLGQKIKCNGRANITYVNPNYNVMIEGERSMKGNVAYLSPKKIFTSVRPESMYFQLTNLTQGDKAALTQKVIDVFQENNIILQREFCAINRMYKSFFSQLFDEISYNAFLTAA